MKRLAAAVLIASLAGCMEPPKGAMREQAVRGLADLHTWDVAMGGKGQYAYDAVMQWGPEIHFTLALHVTDETPTAIYEPLTQRNPVVGDLCFLMLLQLRGLPWQQFSGEGVFLSTALPNPVFCLKWDPGARLRVQRKLLEIIPPPED
jgi:hypothetical protein